MAERFIKDWESKPIVTHNVPGIETEIEAEIETQIELPHQYVVAINGLVLEFWWNWQIISLWSGYDLISCTICSEFSADSADFASGRHKAAPNQNA